MKGRPDHLLQMYSLVLLLLQYEFMKGKVAPVLN